MLIRSHIVYLFYFLTCIRDDTLRFFYQVLWRIICEQVRVRVYVMLACLLFVMKNITHACRTYHATECRVRFRAFRARDINKIVSATISVDIVFRRIANNTHK